MNAMKPGTVVIDQSINGDHIVVRYPTINDVDELLAYINELSAEQTYIGRQGEQLTWEEEEKHVKSILDGMENNMAFQLLLICNGRLTGVCDLHGNKAGVVRHVGGLGISLHHTSRGKGYGSLLMKTLIEEVGKNLPHISIIRLDCFGENEPGLKLYKKFGFVEYGRLPGGFLRKGEPHTHIAMYKKV